MIGSVIICTSSTFTEVIVGYFRWLTKITPRTLPSLTKSVKAKVAAGSWHYLLLLLSNIAIFSSSVGQTGPTRKVSLGLTLKLATA